MKRKVHSMNRKSRFISLLVGILFIISPFVCRYLLYVSDNDIYYLLFLFSLPLFISGFLMIKSAIDDSNTDFNNNSLNINSKDKYLNDYSSIVKKYFSQFDSEEDLLRVLYDKYVKVEKAFNNGDFDVLKENCTSSLYKNLVKQYEGKSDNNKNIIIDDFMLYFYNIDNIVVEDNIVSIQMNLHVSYSECYIDTDGEYIDKDSRPIHKQYLLDFVIDKDKSCTCPNCGSLVSSRYCSYCNTFLKDKYFDFTLSKMGLVENRNIL